MTLTANPGPAVIGQQWRLSTYLQALNRFSFIVESNNLIELSLTWSTELRPFCYCHWCLSKRKYNSLTKILLIMNNTYHSNLRTKSLLLLAFMALAVMKSHSIYAQGDLELIGIEVNQCIQDWNNSVEWCVYDRGVSRARFLYTRRNDRRNSRPNHIDIKRFLR